VGLNIAKDLKKEIRTKQQKRSVEEKIKGGKGMSQEGGRRGRRERRKESKRGLKWGTGSTTPSKWPP